MTARPIDARTGDTGREETVVVSVQQGLRNLVIIGVLAGGLVALVLGAGLLGLALCLFGVWQLTLVLRAKPGLLVDQRWADREGKPRIRSK